MNDIEAAAEREFGVYEQQLARLKDELARVRAEAAQADSWHSETVNEILMNTPEEFGDDIPAEQIAIRWVRHVEAERDRCKTALERIAAGETPAAGAGQLAYDTLDGAVPGPDTIAGLALDRDRLAAENERLSRTLMAAWIATEHGDTEGAGKILSPELDKAHQLAQWNGSETGAEWLERTEAGQEAGR